MTKEESIIIRIAFLNYLKETYPNIKTNGEIKHLKKFESYLKIELSTNAKIN